jgi:hypothetical protein
MEEYLKQASIIFLKMLNKFFMEGDDVYEIKISEICLSYW